MTDDQYFREIAEANNILVTVARMEYESAQESDNQKITVGDEVFSNIDRPPYGLVIAIDYGRKGEALILWGSGLISGLKEEWLNKTGKHYPLEMWMREMRNES